MNQEHGDHDNAQKEIADLVEGSDRSFQRFAEHRITPLLIRELEEGQSRAGVPGSAVEMTQSVSLSAGCTGR